MRQHAGDEIVDEVRRARERESGRLGWFYDGEPDGASNRGVPVLLLLPEETRAHVHVQHAEGEAKSWLHPGVELADRERRGAEGLPAPPALVCDRRRRRRLPSLRRGHGVRVRHGSPPAIPEPHRRAHLLEDSRIAASGSAGDLPPCPTGCACRSAPRRRWRSSPPRRGNWFPRRGRPDGVRKAARRRLRRRASIPVSRHADVFKEFVRRGLPSPASGPHRSNPPDSRGCPAPGRSLQASSSQRSESR